MQYLSNLAQQSKIRWNLGLTTWTIFRYRAYRESFATVFTFSAGLSACGGSGAAYNIDLKGEKTFSQKFTVSFNKNFQMYIFTSGGVSAGVPAVWFWFAVVGPLDWATWLAPSTVTSSSPGMEDSYTQQHNIWNRISWHTSQEDKVFKTANKRNQEATLASRMDRVVSICCMRRDMLASFCRREDKTLDMMMRLAWLSWSCR